MPEGISERRPGVETGVKCLSEMRRDGRAWRRGKMPERNAEGRPDVMVGREPVRERIPGPRRYAMATAKWGPGEVAGGEPAAERVPMRILERLLGALAGGDFAGAAAPLRELRQAIAGAPPEVLLKCLERLEQARRIVLAARAQAAAALLDLPPRPGSWQPRAEEHNLRVRG